MAGLNKLDMLILTAALRSLLENTTLNPEGNKPEEFEDARREGSRILGLLEGWARDYTSTLESLDLTSALWWFIENIDDENPRREQYYWHLRDRMAEFVHSDEVALREMVRQLAQIVYTQNGNRHADINKLLADCTLLIGPKHVIKLSAVSKEDIEGVITVDNPPTPQGMAVIERALAESYERRLRAAPQNRYNDVKRLLLEEAEAGGTGELARLAIQRVDGSSTGG